MNPDHPVDRLRFAREETPTIMSGRVVRWLMVPAPWHNCPEVSASRDGVLISGAWPIMTDDALNDLREVLSLAQKEYLSMRRDRWP